MWKKEIESNKYLAWKVVWSARDAFFAENESFKNWRFLASEVNLSDFTLNTSQCLYRRQWLWLRETIQVVKK